MLLSGSFGRKIVATGTAAVAFAFLYEVTILDSRYAARQAELKAGMTPEREKELIALWRARGGK